MYAFLKPPLDDQLLVNCTFFSKNPDLSMEEEEEEEEEEDDNIDSNSLHLEGFNIPLRKDRTLNGAGIMIYVYSLLNYKVRTDLENR